MPGPLVLGEAFGVALIVYLALLALSLPASAVVLFRGWRTRGAELVYGLLNPLVYLTVIQMQRPASEVRWELAASWIVLGLVWAVRFAGAPLARVLPRGTLWTARVLAVVAFVTILGHAVGDALRHASGELGGAVRGTPLGVGLALTAALLFVIPARMTLAHLRELARATALTPTARFFFFRGTLGAVLGGAFVLVAAATLAVGAVWRPSPDATRATLARHEDAINEAAAQAGVAPRTLAALIAVVHAESAVPLRRAVEEAVMAAWLTDEKSHFLLSRALDHSVGLAQIKPTTAQAALLVHARARAAPEPFYPTPFKEHRDVPPLGPDWELSAEELARVAPPAPSTLGKRAVVQELLDEARSVRYAAFILGLYAAQWEAADPSWSIRDRPEILATLYELGFARSTPHPRPVASAFGRRVLAAAEDPWLAGRFSGSTSGAPTR